MNVVGARPDGWWRDRPGAVRALAARLGAHAARTGVPVTLVVDGRPSADLPEGRSGLLEVLYAPEPGPNAADDRIVALLAERGPARVVTADRALRARVEALGAITSGPRSLLRELDAV